jgi:hypothetical protein
MTHNLVARYGSRTAVINQALVEAMSVTDERLDVIRASHVERLHIFAKMEVAPESELLCLAREFDNLEFRQQKLWGFAQDRDHHRWFDVPRCGCPKRHNENLLSTPMRIVSVDCIIHGQLLPRENQGDDLVSEGIPIGNGRGFIEQWVSADTVPNVRSVNIDNPSCEPLLTFTPRKQ